jgi:FlaA1/EpsC-like NDP-sugar epimerase
MSLARIAHVQRHNLLIALAMLPVFVAIHLTAYWLRFDGEMGSEQWYGIHQTIVWILVIKTAVFAGFRVYHGWRRFVTFHDLMIILKASAISSIVWALVDYLALPSITVPRSVFLADAALTIVAVGGLRSFARLMQERDGREWPWRKSTPVFIVGANDSGEALLRTIRRANGLSYRVLGFLAEDRGCLGSTIGGVPVLGLLEDTCELTRRYGVTEVWITAGELSGRQVRRLVEDGRQAGVVVKVLPSVEQLLRGSIDLRPRTVSIGISCAVSRCSSTCGSCITGWMIACC